MAAKEQISTPSAPQPSGSYSQGIVAHGFLFTAGMGPHDPATGEVVGTTIEEQTHRTLVNLEAALSAVGLTRNDVVKVTAHLSALERDFPGYDRVDRDHFATPFPERTTVGSVLSGILIEMDFIAALETSRA